LIIVEINHGVGGEATLIRLRARCAHDRWICFTGR